MKAAFKLIGAKELERKLSQLPGKVEKDVLRKGCRAATKILAAETIRLAPRRSGAMAAGIKVRAGKRKKRGAIGVQVQLTSKTQKTDTFYAPFVEYGTQFQSPKSFMRRAFDTKKEEARRTALETFKKEIERIATR